MGHGRGLFLGSAALALLAGCASSVGPGDGGPEPAGLHAVELALGDSHSCALLSDGTVRCWGSNDYGQLGDGTTTMRLTPTPVPGLSDVVHLAGGWGNTCALRSDGSLRCWGAVGVSRGPGSSGNPLLPAAVPGLTERVLQVAVGNQFACVVVEGGAVRCWGTNFFSQIGVAPASSTRMGLTTIQGLANITEIAAGESHVCARRSDGHVLCWGRNDSGELGNGATGQPVATPVDVGITDAEHVVVGHWKSCAETRTGNVLCWGGWTSPEVPTSDTGHSVLRPTQFPLLEGQEQLVLALWVDCAVATDRSLLCWGTNFGSQLGVDDVNADRDVPTRVAGLSGIRSVALGDRHACALEQSGGVLCWGANGSGVVGDGTTTTRLVPTRIALP